MFVVVIDSIGSLIMYTNHTSPPRVAFFISGVDYYVTGWARARPGGGGYALQFTRQG